MSDFRSIPDGVFCSSYYREFSDTPETTQTALPTQKTAPRRASRKKAALV